QNYCKETNRSFEEAIQRLKTVLATGNAAEALTPDEWVVFRSVLRMPIPYYLCGLDQQTEGFLRANSRKRSEPWRPHRAHVRPVTIDIRGLRVTSTVRLRITKNVRLIMDAFGLKGDQVSTELLAPTDVKASGGNIFLIVGSSGSGKSVLLKAL